MVGNNGSLNFLSKIFSVVAATAMTVSGAYAGGLERDISLDPEHIALGESFLFGNEALRSTGGAAVVVLTTSSLYPQYTFVSSGVMINEEWGLSAWHAMGDWEGFGEISQRIATGSNFNSNPGETRSVVEVIPFPGSQFNNPDAPDLCLFRVASPVRGIKGIQFASAQEGDLVVGAGFGSFGSEQAGSFPPDGSPRGVRAPVASNVINFFNPQYYQQTIVEPFWNIPQLGRTLPGDSGSGIFDANGGLVGICKGGTNGMSFNGRTTFMKMTGDVQSWINSIAGDNSCPADFNRDGFVDFFDYEEFVNCFDRGECNPGKTADFNGDGFLDFFDYDDLVLAFEQGC